MAEDPSADPPGTSAWGVALRGVAAGVILTLGVVVVVSALEDEPERTTPVAASAAAEQAEPLTKARSEFAQLYLSYLLKTYYVPRRGFCRPLLEKICTSLFRTGLITSDEVCRTVPNDRFVLGIGRYQNKVGLPVDGKAGPETVRMMLGGDFKSREEMAATFCSARPE
ncbi:MAG: peptidoglycan-binding domain-containing protein [Polyangiaceae bacterium]